MCHKQHIVNVVVCEGREGALVDGAETMTDSPSLKWHTYVQTWVFFRTHSPLKLFFYVLFLSSPLRTNLSNILQTCFPWSWCYANTVSAGKPNKAWHSTPSPGLMMSWSHKYCGETAAPATSWHVSKDWWAMGRCVRANRGNFLEVE